MDRAGISHLAYAAHPIAAPLADSVVDALLRSALVGARTVLDLGCGDGTWLLRALRVDPALTAVGATHAFGGLEETVTAMESHLRPAGVLLVAEGIWDRPPSEAVLDLLGAEPDEYADLAGAVALLADLGWVPLHGHVSTPEGWHDYEWSWTGSLVRWAIHHPDDPDRDAVLATATAHRTEWLEGYRGILGFLTVVLSRTDGVRTAGGLLR